MYKSYLFFNKFQELLAQSTDFSRTKMSLQLVLAGLYPPKQTVFNWNPTLNWQPIPYSYEKFSQDSLFLVLVPCPRYQVEYQKVIDTEFAKDLETYAGFFKTLTTNTGITDWSPFQVLSLYSTLKSQESFLRTESKICIKTY